MPYKRRATATKPKRTTKRTYARRSYRKARIPRTLGIYPKITTKKLRYAEFIQFIPTTGVAIQELIYRANDIYDPYQGTGGHQPRGFDQIMLAYQHFAVKSSRIRITMSIADANIGVASSVQCFLSLRGNALSTETDIDLMENPAVKSCVIVPYATTQKTLTMSFDAYKMYKKQMNDSELQGSSTSSPTEQAYFRLGVKNRQGGTATPTINAYIEIDYVAVFTEPVELTIS